MRKYFAWGPVVLLLSLGFASDLPKNTKIEVRLNETLTSDSAELGQRFTAVVSRTLSAGGAVILEKGALAEGVVKYAESTRNYEQPGELHLELTSVTSKGVTYALETSTMVLAGKPSSPASGQNRDGDRKADARRAAIDAISGGTHGASTTIPGTDISVGPSERTGMQVILPAKSKLTFNVVSATISGSPK